MRLSAPVHPASKETRMSPVQLWSVVPTSTVPQTRPATTTTASALVPSRTPVWGQPNAQWLDMKWTAPAPQDSKVLREHAAPGSRLAAGLTASVPAKLPVSTVNVQTPALLSHAAGMPSAKYWTHCLSVQWFVSVSLATRAMLLSSARPWQHVLLAGGSSSMKTRSVCVPPATTWTSREFASAARQN